MITFILRALQGFIFVAVIWIVTFVSGGSLNHLSLIQHVWFAFGVAVLFSIYSGLDRAVRSFLT